MLNIWPNRNHVIIDQTEVKRPARISPLQWLEFWEKVQTMTEHPPKHYESRRYNQAMKAKRNAQKSV